MKNCMNCRYSKPILDGYICVYNKDMVQKFNKPIKQCEFFIKREKGDWFNEILNEQNIPR